MSGTSTSRKWLWWIGAFVALAAVAGIAWALSSSGAAGPGAWNPFSADDTRTASVGSDGATGTLPGAGGSMSTTSGTTGAGVQPGGTGAGGTARPSAPATPPSGEQPTFYVRASWWNDTVKRAPTGFTVAWGTGGEWTPNAASKSQVATIGPFFVGQPQALKISPDGPSGPTVTVPFTITTSMLPSSERDGIHIEIRDDGLRVLGNPVENTERNYPRP